MITAGNRAKETTATSGTGTYFLDGPLAGFQSLVSAAAKTSGVGGPWKVPYVVCDDTDFEVGVGTLTAGGPDTLTRDTIKDSSTGGTAINWGSNTKNVFIAISAEQIAQLTDNDQGNGLLQRTGVDLYGVVALPLAVSLGGTGAATAGAARTALGVDDTTLDGKYTKHSNASAGSERVREVITGLIADIPAPDAGSPGSLYITTDTDFPTSIFWDSGTSWVAVVGATAGPNPIVNGACHVAQQTANALASGDVYSQVDMFIARTTGVGVSAGSAKWASNTNGIGSSEFVLKLEGVTTASSGSIGAVHRIESQNIRHLAGKKISIGVKVRHDVGSAVDFSVRLSSPDAQDDFSAVTLLSTTSAISVSSGTNTTLTFEEIDLGATAVRGLEIEVRVTLSASITTKNFEFTELQLHQGPIVPEFAGADFATELMRCQRYYYSSFNNGTEPQQNLGTLVGSNEVELHSDGYGGFNLRFPVEMFALPTIVTYSPDNSSSQWSVPNNTAHRTAGVGSNANQSGLSIYVSGTNVSDFRDQGFIHFTADARL